MVRFPCVINALSRGQRRHPAVWAGLTVALVVGGSGCRPVNHYRARRHIHKAEAELRTDHLDVALVEFQEAARLAPQMALPHSKIGFIYRRMGDYAKAIDAFLEAVRRDPSSFDDSFHLAQLYYFTHRIKEAIRTYLHAVELKPADFDTQLNLGVCYQQVGDLTQAEGRFLRAIEIDPDRPHAYVDLGVVLDAQGKFYQAIQAYREALERDIKQPLVLVNLARTYMHQERMKMARLSLGHATRMDPQLASAHETLGYCLFRMRDFGEAERSYEKAVTLDRRRPRSHAGLGSIKMLRYLKDKTKTEMRDQALGHWHQSLELDPHQPRIRRLLAKYQPKYRDPEELLLDRREGP